MAFVGAIGPLVASRRLALELVPAIGHRPPYMLVLSKIANGLNIFNKLTGIHLIDQFIFNSSSFTEWSGCSYKNILKVKHLIFNF